MLDKKTLEIIKDTFHIEEKEIQNIELQKAGMTNRSYTFEIRDKKYIIRTPG